MLYISLAALNLNSLNKAIKRDQQCELKQQQELYCLQETHPNITAEVI